jgi:hypothetical protein
MLYLENILQQFMPVDCLTQEPLTVGCDARHAKPLLGIFPPKAFET